MKSTLALTLLLAAVAAPAMAGGVSESVFGGQAILVAQMSQQERRMMRERWEAASPEERTAMRRQFQERMQQMPAEEREAWHQKREERRRQRGEGWTGMMANPPIPAPGTMMPGNFGGNYGAGFEARIPYPEGEIPGGFDPRNAFRPADRQRR